MTKIIRLTESDLTKLVSRAIEEQQKVLAAGRSNNHLDTTALEKDYDVLPIHDAICTVLMKMRD